VRCCVNIIESGHSHVVRDPESRVTCAPYGAKSDQVIGGNRAREVVSHSEEFKKSAAADVHVGFPGPFLHPEGDHCNTLIFSAFDKREKTVDKWWMFPAPVFGSIRKKGDSSMTHLREM